MDLLEPLCSVGSVSISLKSLGAISLETNDDISLSVSDMAGRIHDVPGWEVQLVFQHGSRTVLSLIGFIHFRDFLSEEIWKGHSAGNGRGYLQEALIVGLLKPRSRMSTSVNLLRSPGICQHYRVSDGKKMQVGKAMVRQAFLSI